MPQILSGALIVTGLIGYAALLPTPVTPRGQWLPRSLVASGIAGMCVLLAVLPLEDGTGSLPDRLWSVLNAFGPYVLAGALVLAAGTYLKVRLWSIKNNAANAWHSKYE